MSKNTNKRQEITKTIRFEVFKRDQFKCQYCGASAPDVLLQVDHINPVAKGGGNDVINLITACFACNSGKRDKLLSDKTVVLKQKQQLEQLQERREQLDMMLQWHEGLKILSDDIYKSLKAHWEDNTKGYALNENGMLKIKKWAKAYSFDEILKAMDSAAEQYLVYDENGITSESHEKAFGKIISIIKVNRDSKEDPDLKDFFYIRAIIRNRLQNYDPDLTMDWLRAARSWGASITELKKIASRTRDWNSFHDNIVEIIEKYKRQPESEEIDDLPF